MDSKKSSQHKKIGVVGAGSFGTTIANIIAEKNNVLLLVKDKNQLEEIRSTSMAAGQPILPSISLTTDYEKVAESCDIIFPIVPSLYFRPMMRQLGLFLKPYHILIHGTKGLDTVINNFNQSTELTREHVKTMSEVILEESAVVRAGCLAGPNLAKEIAQSKPAGTVIASHFNEVIVVGQKLLRNNRFLIYGSNDLIGIELCGVLKNIIAIGSGIISGLDLGENAKSLLISRGLVEMVRIGNALGGNLEAFLGLAGVGDLIATCNSPLSRNFTVGYRLAKGETTAQIKGTMEETAEGLNTIELVYALSKTYKVRCPITETLHNIIHSKITVQEANDYLMRYPQKPEVDFMPIT